MLFELPILSVYVLFSCSNLLFECSMCSVHYLPHVAQNIAMYMDLHVHVVKVYVT